MNTKLRDKRRKLLLTQADVAKSAKISERAYQRYEAGDCIPSVATAKMIARALNSTVEELF